MLFSNLNVFVMEQSLIHKLQSKLLCLLFRKCYRKPPAAILMLIRLRTLFSKLNNLTISFTIWHRLMKFQKAQRKCVSANSFKLLSFGEDLINSLISFLFVWGENHLDIHASIHMKCLTFRLAKKLAGNPRYSRQFFIYSFWSTPIWNMADWA